MPPACLRLAAATAFPPTPAGDPALTRAMFIALVLLTAAAPLWVLAFALPLAIWLGLLAALA